MVMEDHQLKLREIAEAVGMSSEWVYHILTEELGMKKLPIRWVLQLLTSDHKCTREKCPSKVFSATNKIFCAGL